MTEILKRLEKKDFLRCETSRRDRRFKCVSSTAKARGLRQEAEQLEEETLRWLSQGLSPGELDSFLSVLDKMLQNVWAQCPKGCEREE